MNKWQIVTSVVVALIAVLSLSEVAFAQGPTPPTSMAQDFGRGMRTNGAQGQMGGYGFRFGANGESLVDITAKVTGFKVEDVVKELQVGKTFADIATANGKTATDLVNAFLADRKIALDKAVTDGRLTKDAADALLATMKTNVEQHVNSTWSQIPFRGQPYGMDYRFTSQQPQPQGLGPRWNR